MDRLRICPAAQRLHHPLRIAVLLAVLAATFAAIGVAAPIARADDGSESAAAADLAGSTDLTGRVYTWHEGRLRPVGMANVSTGAALTRTDANGFFRFAPDQRSDMIHVVRAGYHVVERPVYRDHAIIVLRNVIVRAIFVPFSEAAKPAVQRLVHGLVTDGLINAVVIDIKDEAGHVYDFAATDTARDIQAVIDDEGIPEFLEALGERGVYRIGRIVTFLDNRYPRGRPNDSLYHVNGSIFIDDLGSSWASPIQAGARSYNIGIAVAAADQFEEIQFDYVRFPYEPGLRERSYYSSDQRNQAIGAFAREAGEALHLAGVAVAFDTFGIVAVASSDQGIGQSYDELAPHLDYVSPMVYPSGWDEGHFGLSYPPAHPGVVVRESVSAVTDRAHEWGPVQVRPWLQDFRDYRARGLYYGADEVAAQIRAASDAGGAGFMLWDPSLSYQTDALESTRDLAWNPSNLLTTTDPATEPSAANP